MPKAIEINGCIKVTKWLGMTIAIVTVVSLIWGFATNYAMDKNFKPVKDDVAQLKNRMSESEKNFLANRERLISIETKQDLLLSHFGIEKNGK